MEEKRQNITRKIRLTPVGDKEEVKRVYKYLQEGISNQNRAMNLYISSLFAQFMTEQTEDRIELSKLYSRMQNSNLPTAYNSKEFEFAKGLGSTSSIVHEVNKDFKNALKKGVQFGNISLPSYSKNYPLLVPKRFIGLYHKYEAHNDFLEHLHEKDLELFIGFVNEITFKLEFGMPHKSTEIREVFRQIFEENYSIRDSKIAIKNNHIYLYLVLSIPIKKKKLLKENKMSVIFGETAPIICMTNTSSRLWNIGDLDVAKNYKEQNAANYKRMMKQTINRGGQGYKHKFIHKMKDYDVKLKKFANSYNHKIAKDIIDYAIKKQVKTIHIESSTSIGNAQRKNKALGDWTYFEIISLVKYKANICGIEVKEIVSSDIWSVCASCGAKLNEDTNSCLNVDCDMYNKKIKKEKNALKYLLNSNEVVNKKKKKEKKK